MAAYTLFTTSWRTLKKHKPYRSRAYAEDRSELTLPAPTQTEPQQAQPQQRQGGWLGHGLNSGQTAAEAAATKIAAATGAVENIAIVRDGVGIQGDRRVKGDCSAAQNTCGSV